MSTSPAFLVPPDSLEFIPENYLHPLSWAALFPHRAWPMEARPLEIDLGCGDGAFLAGMAARHPECDFLGVERLLGRVRKTCRRLARAVALKEETDSPGSFPHFNHSNPRRSPNARVLRLESHYLVRYLIPPESVNRFYLLFPDPWPKRRHQQKRLFQTEFLNDAHTALLPGGELCLATDNLPYFEQMQAVFQEHPGFAPEPWMPGEDAPRTDFERFFRQQGLPIHRVLLRKKTA